MAVVLEEKWPVLSRHTGGWVVWADLGGDARAGVWRGAAPRGAVLAARCRTGGVTAARSATAAISCPACWPRRSLPSPA